MKAKAYSDTPAGRKCQKNQGSRPTRPGTAFAQDETGADHESSEVPSSVAHRGSKSGPGTVECSRGRRSGTRQARRLRHRSMGATDFEPRLGSGGWDRIATGSSADGSVVPRCRVPRAATDSRRNAASHVVSTGISRAGRGRRPLGSAHSQRGVGLKDRGSGLKQNLGVGARALPRRHLGLATTHRRAGRPGGLPRVSSPLREAPALRHPLSNQRHILSRSQGQQPPWDRHQRISSVEGPPWLFTKSSK